jgi:hypothetical protein
LLIFNPDLWDDHTGCKSGQKFATEPAIDLPWSNGQAEGQINRLKTIKRAMYGRAGQELLRARMMPIKLPELHTK